MRPIGNLPDEKQARVFADFLMANGVKSEVDHDGSVWVVEEERISDAQKWLQQFRQNPDAPEFQDVTARAAKVREAEAKDLADYRRRVRTSKSLFPKFGGYGVGVLTYALIFACVIVAVYSKLGDNLEALRPLYIMDPMAEDLSLFGQIRSGDVWRLFTPIFIHFSWLHIIFNMLWLFQLGCMIEGRQGTWMLALLVAVTALLSNVAQFSHTHYPIFGGMSGVVYGLAGYVWMRGKHDHRSGLYLDPQSVMILLIWLVVCYTGWVGNIANTAHVVGLATGVLWGRASAYIASRTPE